MSASAITLENSRGWGVRVPRLFVALGIPITTALLMFVIPLEEDTYYTSIEEATSWWELVGGSLFGLVIASTVLAWYRPRLCMWVYAISVITYVAAPPVWMPALALGSFWLAVALLDAYLLARQHALSADWYGSDGPPALAQNESPRWIEEDTIFPSLASLALVLVALGSSYFYIQNRAELIALGDRAVSSSAKVVDQDTAFDSIFMKVDGKEYEFFVNDASDHPVGSTVPIFVDPTGEHRPYTGEDVDPNGTTDFALIPIPALILAALLAVAPRRRRARALEMLHANSPRTQAWIAPDPDGNGFLVHAVDDLEHRSPMALIPDLQVIKSPAFDQHEPDRAIPPWPLVIKDIVVRGFWALFGPAEGKGEWDEGQFDEDETAFDFPFTHGESVTIRGLRADGGSFVIEHTSPEAEPLVSVTTGPTRDPHTVSAIATRAFSRFRPATNPGRHVVGSRRRPERDPFGPFITRSSVIGPVLVIATLFFALRWLNAPDPEFDDSFVIPGLGIAVALAFFVAEWSSRGRPAATARSFGLVVTGGMLDSVVPTHRIVSATADNEHVTLELRDPSDRLVIVADDLTASKADNVQLIVAAAKAVIASGTTTSPHSAWETPRLLPSRSTVFAVLTVAAALVALFLPY